MALILMHNWTGHLIVPAGQMKYWKFRSLLALVDMGHVGNHQLWEGEEEICTKGINRRHGTPELLIRWKGVESTRHVHNQGETSFYCNNRQSLTCLLLVCGWWW